MARGSKARHWCFTLNNYTPEELPKLGEGIDYLVYGKEICPKSKTPHLQGYIVFTNRKYMSAVKKLMPRAHLEVKAKNSTVEQASEYCKKDGDFVECGERPKEKNEAGGTANKERFDAAYALALVGEFDKIPKDILIRYYHALKRIYQDNMERAVSLDDVCGTWYYGDPGTGKSMKARALSDSWYDKSCNKWWDGYRGEDIIVIDDFDMAHKCLGHHLKRWGDKYSFPAEIKGTTVQIRPKRIVVTSNYMISTIFGEDPVLVEALKRRYEEVEFVKDPMDEEVDLNPVPNWKYPIQGCIDLRRPMDLSYLTNSLYVKDSDLINPL